MTASERLSEDAILAQVEAARRHGALADTAEPRAVSAHYDAASGRVMLELRDGAVFGFRADAEPALAGLPANELATVRVASRGSVLHWPGADVHIDVPGLIAHVVNMAAWAPKYLGGRTSTAKARAARENGRKGGRPRKRDAA
ncbi:MAG TPA: DUF2442 domain-containing protein [Longimicrobiaceae bacterium]